MLRRRAGAGLDSGAAWRERAAGEADADGVGCGAVGDPLFDCVPPVLDELGLDHV